MASGNTPVHVLQLFAPPPPAAAAETPPPPLLLIPADADPVPLPAPTPAPAPADAMDVLPYTIITYQNPWMMHRKN